MMLAGTFEPNEIDFVGRFFQPGMVALDAGAHQGLYTLWIAKHVETTGRVYAFEPSPRERKALRLNLSLNRCRNVQVQPFALGTEETTADLYVVNEIETGCNSLRPPNTPGATSTIAVRIRTLDNWLVEHGLNRIDFLKLDVEGAELSVLKGATRLLTEQPRPVVMAEVESIRTKPWGYSPLDIIRLLENMSFSWFKAIPGGRLRSFHEGSDEFVGNLVAIPAECREAVLARVS
jgi:FkbM family methyltransferase